MRVSSGKSLRSPPFDGGTVSTIGKDRMKLPHRRQISAFGGRRSCAASGLAHRIGASLSDAAGAFDRRCPRRRRKRLFARLMGQWLSERLGQPFVTENRPGGGSNIATEAVVRAPADGYTLLLISCSLTIPGRSPSATNRITSCGRWAKHWVVGETTAIIAASTKPHCRLRIILLRS
jgi:hypothetical protein